MFQLRHTVSPANVRLLQCLAGVYILPDLPIEMLVADIITIFQSLFNPYVFPLVLNFSFGNFVHSLEEYLPLMF